MSVLLLALAWAHPGGHERIAEVERDKLQGDCPAAGLVERGTIWFQMSHYPEALADFAAARACDPAVPDVNREEARVWHMTGHPEVARVLLELHLRQAPRDGNARVLFARVLSTLGEWEAADSAWTAALKGVPTITPDHLLDWVDARSVAQGPQQALDLLLSHRRATAGSPAVEERLVDLLVAVGRHDDAIGVLDQTLAAQPPDLRARLRRGDVLAAAGRTDEARAAWSAVLEQYEALPPRLKNPSTEALRDEAKRRLR